MYKFKNSLLSVIFVFVFFQIYSQNNWNIDFDKVVNKAKSENKLILIDFTGSDWCMPCKMLEKNIFQSTQFVDFAKDSLILLKVDFPKRPENKLDSLQQRANNILGNKYGIKGLPTVIIMDGNQNEMDRIVGYPGLTPEEFLNKIRQLIGKSQKVEIKN